MGGEGQERKKVRTETMIFPRYHRLMRAKLTAAAKANGAGTN